MRNYRILFGLLVLLILSSNIILCIHSGNSLRYPDEKDYDRLARSIIYGASYVSPDSHSVTAYRAPGYAFFLASVYLIDNHPVAAKIANAVLFTLTTLILASMVKRVSTLGSLICLFIALCYPVFAYACTTLYPQILGSLLFLASVWILTRAPPSNPSVLLAAISYGVLVLTIPSFQLLIPVILTYSIFFFFRQRARVYQAFLFLFGIALTISPWAVRNYAHFHALIPVSLNSGENLLLGNSENTRSNSGVNSDIKRYREEAKDMNEIQRDAFFRHSAIKWMRDNPVPAVSLYLKKVLNYFNFRNELYVASERSPFRDKLLFLSFYPILFLGLMRLFVHKLPFKAPELFLYLLYFVNAFLSAIFFTRIRFRIPFDFLLIAIVAMFLGREIDRYMNQKRGLPLQANDPT